MKPLNARIIIRVLLKNGFVRSRKSGSHEIYWNPQTHISVPVPIHGKSKQLPIGTFLAIVRQSGIPAQRWMK